MEHFSFWGLFGVNKNSTQIFSLIFQSFANDDKRKMMLGHFDEPTFRLNHNFTVELSYIKPTLLINGSFPDSVFLYFRLFNTFDSE